MKLALSCALLAALSLPVLADDQTPEQLFHQGWYQETGLKDLEAALASYAKVVERQKESESYAARAQFQIGVCLEKLGKKEEAAKAFQKVVEAYPQQKEWVDKAKEKVKGEPAQSQDPDEAVREKMKSKKVSLNFTDAPLPDVLTFLREYSELNIILDAKVEHAEDKKVTFKVEGISLDNAFGLIIRMLDLDWCVEDGLIVVSTPERIRARAKASKKEAAPAGGAEPWKAEIEKKLDGTKIDLNFTDASLEDIMEFLRDYAGLNIEFDKAVRDDGTPDQKITLQLRNAPMKTALKHCLDQYDLTWELTNQVILITKHKEAH